MTQRDDAANTLFEANHKLAMHWAHWAARRHMQLEYDDALVVAEIGLWRSAETYDPSRGYTFSTYASTMIKNALIVEGKRMYRQNHADQRVDLYHHEQGEELEFELEDPTAEFEENFIEIEALREAVTRAWDQLTPLQQRVLALRFSKPYPSYNEIATQLGVKATTARNHMTRALALIRQTLKGVGLRGPRRP